MRAVRQHVIVVALVAGCRGREQPGYTPTAAEGRTAPAVAADAVTGQGGAAGDAASRLPAAAAGGDRRAQVGATNRARRSIGPSTR